jgi:hypothetical protein
MSSTEDYLITDCNNFKHLCNMCILNMNEYSYNCPIIFSFKCSIVLNDGHNQYTYRLYGKIEKDKLLNILLRKVEIFDDIKF